MGDKTKIFVLFMVLLETSHEQREGPTKDQVLDYTSQGVPDHCTTNEFDDLDCCNIPPFFVSEVAEACNVIFKPVRVHKESNFMIWRRHLVPCKSWYCILDKYHLMNTDKTLNEDMYYAHLKEWTELNEDFKELMLKAKTHCDLKYRGLKPITSCLYTSFHKCLRQYLKLDCPIPRLAYNALCYAQKKFYDECRQYFW